MAKNKGGQPHNNNNGNGTGQNTGAGGDKQQNGQGTRRTNWYNGNRRKPAKGNETEDNGQATGMNATPPGNDARNDSPALNALQPDTVPAVTETSPEPTHKGPPMSPVKNAAPEMLSKSIVAEPDILPSSSRSTDLEKQSDKGKEPAATGAASQQEEHSATAENHRKITHETLEAIGNDIKRMQGIVKKESGGKHPLVIKAMEDMERKIIYQQRQLQTDRMLLLTSLRHAKDTKKNEIEVKKRDPNDGDYKGTVRLQNQAKQLEKDIAELEKKITEDGGDPGIHVPRVQVYMAKQSTTAASEEGKGPGDAPTQGSVAKDRDQESAIESHPQFMHAGLMRLEKLEKSLVEKRTDFKKLSTHDPARIELEGAISQEQSTLRNERVSILKEWDDRIKSCEAYEGHRDPKLSRMQATMRELEKKIDEDKSSAVAVVDAAKSVVAEQAAAEKAASKTPSNLQSTSSVEEVPILQDSLKPLEQDAESAAAGKPDLIERTSATQTVAEGLVESDKSAASKSLDLDLDPTSSSTKPAKEMAALSETPKSGSSNGAPPQPALEKADIAKSTKGTTDNVGTAPKKLSVGAVDATEDSARLIKKSSLAAKKTKEHKPLTGAPESEATEVPKTTSLNQQQANTTEHPASKESTEELVKVKAELARTQLHLQKAIEDLELMRKQKQEWQARAFSLMQQANHHLQPLQSMINSTADIQQSLQSSPTFMSRFHAGEVDGQTHSVETRESES